MKTSQGGCNGKRGNSSAILSPTSCGEEYLVGDLTDPPNLLFSTSFSSLEENDGIQQEDELFLHSFDDRLLLLSPNSPTKIIKHEENEDSDVSKQDISSCLYKESEKAPVKVKQEKEKDTDDENFQIEEDRKPIIALPSSGESPKEKREEVDKDDSKVSVQDDMTSTACLRRSEKAGEDRGSGSTLESMPTTEKTAKEPPSSFEGILRKGENQVCLSHPLLSSQLENKTMVSPLESYILASPARVMNRSNGNNVSHFVEYPNGHSYTGWTRGCRDNYKNGIRQNYSDTVYKTPVREEAKVGDKKTEREHPGWNHQLLLPEIGELEQGSSLFSTDQRRINKSPFAPRRTSNFNTMLKDMKALFGERKDRPALRLDARVGNVASMEVNNGHTNTTYPYQGAGKINRVSTPRTDIATRGADAQTKKNSPSRLFVPSASAAAAACGGASCSEVKLHKTQQAQSQGTVAVTPGGVPTIVRSATMPILPRVGFALQGASGQWKYLAAPALMQPRRPAMPVQAKQTNYGAKRPSTADAASRKASASRAHLLHPVPARQGSTFPVEKHTFPSVRNVRGAPETIPFAAHATIMLSNKDVRKKRGMAFTKEEIAMMGKSNKKQRKDKTRFLDFQTETWTHRLYEAMDFRNKFGHCCIPCKYPPNQQLSTWAKRQRHQYQLYIKEGQKLGRVKNAAGSTMTEERIRALERIGFCFDQREASWFIRFEELRAFASEKGHTNVPIAHSNEKLAVWVKLQRNQYRRWTQGSYSSLTAERKRLLDSIGFAWNPNARRSRVVSQPDDVASQGRCRY